MSQVNTELGRSSTASISLGETAVRTLAGVPSGAISMDNLRGKSAVTFTPDGGTSSGARVTLEDTGINSASVTINCSTFAVWTWTRTGSTAGTASVGSGGTSSTITFSITSSGGSGRASTFTVNATAGDITRYYTVFVYAEGNA